MHADWSRAAAWLLPELRLLPKDRPSHSRGSLIGRAMVTPPVARRLVEGRRVAPPRTLPSSKGPPLTQEVEQHVSAGAPPTTDVSQSEVKEAK